MCAGGVLDSTSSLRDTMALQGTMCKKNEGKTQQIMVQLGELQAGANRFSEAVRKEFDGIYAKDYATTGQIAGVRLQIADLRKLPDSADLLAVEVEKQLKKFCPDFTSEVI